MLKQVSSNVARYNDNARKRQYPHGRGGTSPRQARLIWTLGNLLMLIGAYLMLYVGGLYVQIEHSRRAARGDSELPAPQAVSAGWRAESAIPFNVPVLNTEGRVLGSVPSDDQAQHVATVSRIIIPSIGVDSKVVEVGWVIEEQNGTEVAVWEVAEYAVGQHKGSGNPGEGSNTVLAGHVGGYGKVFKDLFFVQPGDQVTLYSKGQQYLYVVQERLVVDEEGVPPEQRAANARYMDPTDHEVVTLITCWPPSGPDRFTQRVIVQAVPYGAVHSGDQGGDSAWQAR